MNLAAALTELSLNDLHRRRSAKWSWYAADVLPAWVAEMDFPVAPAIRTALLEAIERDDLGYANPGACGLGETFAGFAARRLDWQVDPEQVTPLSDVVDGLSELVRVLTEPGDGVVINPPVYHPFFSLIAEAGREVAEVPLHDGRTLDVAGIERAFAAGARALILCNPHNPTGQVLSGDELERVATAAAAHDAWVLADEVHAPLVLAGARHVPFTTVSPEAAARGIVLTSASKTFNLAGLKSAQAITAAETARAMVAKLPEIATHSGHLGVLASVAAFDDADGWLDEVLTVLDSNRRLLAELLEAHLPEVTYRQPEAGYLAWIDVSALELGDDPAAAFLERGRVGVSPGSQFGSGGSGFVRLNYATSPAILEQVVERMARAIGR